jgi:hypothetical protein
MPAALRLPTPVCPSAAPKLLPELPFFNLYLDLLVDLDLAFI